jgi:hypothetical protein
MTGLPLLHLNLRISQILTHFHVTRVIIRLGPPSAHLSGFDIDTANFNGNEAPAASVHALTLQGDDKVDFQDERASFLLEISLHPDSYLSLWGYMNLVGRTRAYRPSRSFVAASVLDSQDG